MSCAADTWHATCSHYRTWPEVRAADIARPGGDQCGCPQLRRQLPEDDSAAGGGRCSPSDDQQLLLYEHRCQSCAAPSCVHPCGDPARHWSKLGGVQAASAPPPDQSYGPRCCCHLARQRRSSTAVVTGSLNTLPIAYDARTRQLLRATAPLYISASEADGRSDKQSLLDDERRRTDSVTAPSPDGADSVLPSVTGADEERDSGVSDSPGSTLTPGVPPPVCAAALLLARADGGVFGSDSSLSTELSVYSDDRSPAPESRLSGGKRKTGISAILSRGLFGWRSREGSSGEEVAQNSGWSLFLKPSTSSASASRSVTTVSSSTSLLSLSSSAGDSPCRTPRSSAAAAAVGADLQAGSMALILEDRPDQLPAKSSPERRRHRREYQRIVESAMRKEQSDNKSKKKAMQAQLKSEQSIAQNTRVWNQEILPNWDKVRGTRRVQDLWWLGLPPSVRGRVWHHAIGNQLHITRQLYDVYYDESRLIRHTLDAPPPAAGDVTDSVAGLKRASVELVRLDVARTFPQLGLFQKGGPLHELLHQLLGVYVCYRPDIGYIQGMSFIAAVLLLNMDIGDAFLCLANLLNRPCLFQFFQLDRRWMGAYYATYRDLLRESMPALCTHMECEGVTPDLYLVDWLYTLFSKSLPLDVACRIWDVYLRDGEYFLFRAALGLLHMHQQHLMQLEFVPLAQFLTGMPDDLDSDALFRSVQKVRTSLGKLSFNELLQQHYRDDPVPVEL